MILKYLSMSLMLVALLLLGCQDVAPPAPVQPLPSEAQVQYQEMEMNMFIHFNMNTFTNKEWGFGDASPEQFNPTELDPRQWARIAKEAGMKGMILTAKHHDGFCLWPSKYTEHSVKNSPWKDGKGDLVQEFVDACREYDLKVGLYLSPWDRNHKDYGKPEYLTYFRNQLEELLTNYGDVFEVWFDGANGGSGYYGGANEMRKVDRETYYDWDFNNSLVLKYQPNAIIFSDAGPGARWVGNEEGWANPTNWSLLRKAEVYPGFAEYKQLRSGHEDGTHWVPAECDVSIRPGWYYHTYEDNKVRPLSEMIDIYYHSVGRNGTLLLNFPVDQRGLIHENDEARIKELTEVINADFKTNLASTAAISASNVRGNSKTYSADKMIDSSTDSYWATDDQVIESSFTIAFDEPTKFNRVLLQENIRLGQRVQEFSVEAEVDGKWEQIADETTIGYKRILRLQPVTASAVRINIDNAKGSPVINNVGVYNAPVRLFEPEVTRDKAGNVSIKTTQKGVEIRYTLDGTEPTESANLYEGPFVVNSKKIVKAIVLDKASDMKSEAKTVEFDVSKEKWKVVSVSSGDLASAERVIDDNTHSTWGTEKGQPMPQEIVIDLGEKLQLSGFTYLPKQWGHIDGTLVDYSFYVSMDGRNWGSPVAKGEFSNIRNNNVLQKIDFKSIPARYIKMVGHTEIYGDNYARFAEIGVITD